MKMRLRDVASVIRSKNAGPFELTLDILLRVVQGRITIDSPFGDLL